MKVVKYVFGLGQSGQEGGDMVLIGESIHIISTEVNDAVKDRNPKVIQDLAAAQAKAAADYIDINLGPARKDPEDVTQWLVNTIQEVKLMLPLAKKHSTDVVISVLTDKGCPPDVDSRIESIMETVAYANELGIPNEDIWVDPIILPVSADQKQVAEAAEFISMLADLLPGVKSTVGLSNVSNGTPEELRGILNRTYMVMLGRNGLYSAIADVLDKELVSLNKGELPNIVDLIHKTMDGEVVDTSSLSQKEQDYVKTTKVLMGETLYSHAWLES
jgi:5-methyltetrahydrofolate corrinoid/iron sulfur protein methyltransferase